ncbi:type-F conjugative transfer system secretin TraK [Cupriavidus basilensis]|uniref:Type-F conjugative transfer system secretin TraK n=1 Tax=Cupriavidus basilensis TaxID=68895 RepID=A0ABT6B636_9BURK|nr:type-F conjugative transfer system secretin TraK [Cupriavidus basilensis]MDF3840057.1 type-F conjugative transfer system secretin TraK [Cupriavidus basilensis]
MRATEERAARARPDCRTTRMPALPAAARRVIALTALSFGFPTYALQVVEASDGVSVEAIVSVKEPTRIRIENAPITDVFGNIHSSQCGSGAALPTMPGSPSAAPAVPVTNPAGDVVVECDKDKGEIYIRPVGDGGKPINLFVSSASATYTLLLRRADTPADTIVIRDKTPKALHGKASQATATPSPNHIRAMKALLVAMASDRVPPDIRVEETHRPLQLWQEAKFALVRRYEGRGLVGEKYLLQNVSAEPMGLSEQEFDRDGGEVAGIAIEHHNLRPGASTSVYVIRRGGAQ